MERSLVRECLIYSLSFRRAHESDVGIRYTHPRNSAKVCNKACEPAERRYATEFNEVALRNVKKQTEVFGMSKGHWQGTPVWLTLANMRGALRSTARPWSVLEPI